MHTGPGAHILHFPVANHTFLNIVAFVDEPNDWPVGDFNTVGNMVAPAAREDVQKAFSGWGPTVRKLVDLLPDRFDKWAIFDTYDNPAPTFIQGRVCLAGDAAHASSPHHGAGAGIGVEDALAICTILEQAREKLGLALARGSSLDKGKEEGEVKGDVAHSNGNGVHTANKVNSVSAEKEVNSTNPQKQNATNGIHDKNTTIQREKSAIIEAAWTLYNRVRPPRSQWLVKSSREACDIYEWKYPPTGTDWDKCLAEITARSHRLWYFDFRRMVEECRQL